MKWQEVSQLPREKLLVLLENALGNFVRMDAYWFLGTEKLCGQEKAVQLDEEVWRRYGRVEARQVKELLGLGSDMNSLVQALRALPSWTFFGNYEIDTISPTRVIFRVTHCYPQKERVRMGLGVFPCQGVEEAFFGSFVREFNPDIKVRRLSSPPDSYSEDLWCSWEFIQGGK